MCQLQYLLTDLCSGFELTEDFTLCHLITTVDDDGDHDELCVSGIEKVFIQQ